MIYAPTDLRAVKLRDVPAGTILEFTHRADDIPCAIKLADDADSASWILPLSGPYAFHVIPWSNDGEITTTLCKPDAIRFKLGPSSWKESHQNLGVLTLHSVGAFIATAKEHHSRGPKIDVKNWAAVEVANIDDSCAKHPNWEAGYIDAKHEFVPIFKRRSKTD